MEQSTTNLRRLSPQRAFVVQFREHVDPTANIWEGRVEHISSGQFTTFAEREEILAFIEKILLQAMIIESKGS